MDQIVKHIFIEGCQRPLYHGKIEGSDLYVSVDVSVQNFDWPQDLPKQVIVQDVAAEVVSEEFGIIKFVTPMDKVQERLSEAVIRTIHTHCNLKFRCLNNISPVNVIAKIVTVEGEISVFESNNFQLVYDNTDRLLRCKMSYSTYNEVTLNNPTRFAENQ